MIFFFSFSDLYPSVSPSWLSSVESLSPLFWIDPTIARTRERNLINSTSSTTIFNSLGSSSDKSNRRRRINPYTTKKSIWWKTFSWESKMKVYWTSKLCFDFLSMSHTHVKLWVINDESHKFSLASVALVRYLTPVRFLGDFLFAKETVRTCYEYVPYLNVKINFVPVGFY